MQLEDLAPLLLAPDKLVVKTINGNSVTGKDLLEYFKVTMVYIVIYHGIKSAKQNLKIQYSVGNEEISVFTKLLLNQARAGHRPARTWFLEIAFVQEVSVCVCVCVCE